MLDNTTLSRWIVRIIISLNKTDRTLRAQVNCLLAWNYAVLALVLYIGNTTHTGTSYYNWSTMLLLMDYLKPLGWGLLG